MSYLMNNQQKLNEIVFANRNKEYGAYAIRSEYGSTVLKSVSIVSFGFGSIMAIAFYLGNQNKLPDRKPNVGPNIVDTATIFVIPPPDVTPDNPPPSGGTTPPTSPVENPEDLFDAVIRDSTLTPERTVLQGTPSVETSTALSTGKGLGIGGNGLDSLSNNTADSKTVEPYSDFSVDSGPEFEGGLKALYAFLAKNLRYPPPAADLGVGGTLHVKFVVDETGSVSTPRLLNQIGYGMDEEAIRVVSIIPKFKSPAKVKGRAVKAYFQLPIKFKPQ